jgi:hypothetical protein
MQFLKKHYEKLILSLVLVGLAIAAALLPIQVSKEKNIIEDFRQEVSRNPKALSPEDLSEPLTVIRGMGNLNEPTLSGGNNLFNPVRWQKRSDGALIKNEAGKEVNNLRITEIRPLFLRLEYLEPSPSGERVRYKIKITQEASSTSSLRNGATRYITMERGNDIITLKEVKGPEENPETLVLELVETKQEVSIKLTQPYEAIEGYAADMVYQADGKAFMDKRVDDGLVFGGDSYKIVAITESEVVLSANSNNKRTSIKLN